MAVSHVFMVSVFLLSLVLVSGLLQPIFDSIRFPSEGTIVSEGNVSELVSSSGYSEEFK